MDGRKSNRRTLAVYLDESYKDAHRFLVIGGISLESDFLDDLTAKFSAVRRLHNTFGEVKWVKTSRSKLNFYKDFVDVFFEQCKPDELRFSALYIDTHTFNNKRWNSGSREIGFNKLIYQLLLHKFGRRYGNEYPLEVYLDKRTTKHYPEDMRPMLNADLRKRWGVHTDPFRRVTFIDSKKSEVVQLVDLLNGSIGFFKNRHHKNVDGAPHKLELARHILQKINTCQPERPNSVKATKFAVWPFAYKIKRGVLRA